MWSDTGTYTTDWLTTAGTTDSLTCSYTLSLPDSYIDWLPNSCLYPKYIPTWHLIQSYRTD